MTTPNITGDYAPGFKVLKTAFETNFKEHGEIGASLCIYQHGEKAVSYTHLTLPTIYSV